MLCSQCQQPVAMTGNKPAPPASASAAASPAHAPPPSPSSAAHAATDASSMTSDGYVFPTHRLRPLQDQGRTPLVLVACGSFSPPTYLHLRIFEIAKDWARFNTSFEVVGGYMSPVGSAYKKAGLAPAEHRINMCQLAVGQGSKWIMVDEWEARKKEYQPTAIVLDHFEQEINQRYGGIPVQSPASPHASLPTHDFTSWTGQRRKARIVLLAGSDLIATMGTPGVWAPEDLDHILGDYGAFIVERSGTDTEESLRGLEKWRKNIYLLQQLVSNDVSSTKIRLFLKRDMSIRYLVPEHVIHYIDEHNLYSAEEQGSSNTQLAEGSGSAS